MIETQSYIGLSTHPNLGCPERRPVANTERTDREWLAHCGADIGRTALNSLFALRSGSPG